MTGEHEAPGAISTSEHASDVVEQERSELRDFVRSLNTEDIKSGGWFSKLLAHSLGTYAAKANWQYFQEKYQGVPPDAIVDQRIKMAARYAAVEGGLSASAYTAAIVTTLGTGGGASPATVPAALTTMMIDVVYVTQLQLRLAHDIAVLYRVPLDINDPDDLWKLIRVALNIKGGELLRGGVVKVAPPLTRQLIRRFYSRGVLTAARSLPYVGRVLLQRNVIKVGIPGVGVPLAVLINRYTTLVAGEHARKIFRNEARILELARRLSHRTSDPRALLWVSWMMVRADGKVSDDEVLLMKDLALVIRQEHDTVDETLAQVIDFDHQEVWSRLVGLSDGEALSDAALAVAEVDGPANSRERAKLEELRSRILGEFSSRARDR